MNTGDFSSWLVKTGMSLWGEEATAKPFWNISLPCLLHCLLNLFSPVHFYIFWKSSLETKICVFSSNFSKIKMVKMGKKLGSQLWNPRIIITCSGQSHTKMLHLVQEEVCVNSLPCTQACCVLMTILRAPAHLPFSSATQTQHTASCFLDPMGACFMFASPHSAWLNSTHCPLP